MRLWLMPRSGAAPAMLTSRSSCIVCFCRQRQTNSLTQARMSRAAWARRITRATFSRRASHAGRFRAGVSVGGRAECACRIAPRSRWLRRLGVHSIPWYLRHRGSAAESRDLQCFSENSSRNPLRVVHKKSAKNGPRSIAALKITFRSASRRDVRAIRATLCW